MVSPFSQIVGRLRMRHLRLLAVLTECNSLRQAADIMSQTQPALTKSLQEIEEIIGEPLFLRTPKGIQANMLGEVLTRYACLVYTDMDGMHKELNALKSGSIGKISIGGIQALSNTLLPQTIAVLKKEYPSLGITVEVETSDQLLKALEQDKLDVVIARIPEGCPDKALNFTALGAELIVPVARLGHPEMGNPNISLNALQKYCWVIQSQPAPLRVFFHQLFREQALASPTSTVETSSTLLSLALLKESDMVSLQPASLVDYYERIGLIGRLPIPISIKMNSYGLITRKNRIPTAAMEIVQRTFLEQSRMKNHSFLDATS